MRTHPACFQCGERAEGQARIGLHRVRDVRGRAALARGLSRTLAGRLASHLRAPWWRKNGTLTFPTLVDFPSRLVGDLERVTRTPDLRNPFRTHEGGPSEATRSPEARRRQL